MTISKLRTYLYTSARVLGDIQAIRGGPKAMAKRIMRKLAGRAMGGVLGRMLR